MNKQLKVKSPRKRISPVFHLQTKREEEHHITEDLVKAVRSTGQLNLSSKHLSCVPENLFAIYEITDENDLSLDFNCISKTNEAWWNMKPLTYLDLSSNVLTCIPGQIDMFQDLAVLNDISNNQISALPSGVGFLVRLMELDISNNRLIKLPPDIVNLRGLLKMDISQNSIEHLPDMGELRKLQIFYAQHNDLQEIPSFRGCEQLQEVYFGNNFIQEIPIEFCENMFHLKTLVLRDNKIKVVPSEITHMVHLTKLDLTNNDISELPNSIGLMAHLQNFLLEGNKLKQIRVDIIKSGTIRILKHLREKLTEQEMKSINVLPSHTGSNVKIFPDRYIIRQGNVLNLAMKDISEIPDECFNEAQEAKVCVVDLCKNKFTEVPLGLSFLGDYVTELNLSTNRLKDVPEFLARFTKLKFCDLSKNSIKHLPESYASLTSLRELILSYNKFTAVPNPIYGMVGLEILLLNGNNIEEINVEKMKNLKRLATLDLSNNNILSIPPELGNMTQLRILELKGNPFRQPRYAILDQGTEAVLSYLRDKIPL